MNPFALRIPMTDFLDPPAPTPADALAELKAQIETELAQGK